MVPLDLPSNGYIWREVDHSGAMTDPIGRRRPAAIVLHVMMLIGGMALTVIACVDSC
jgi:hypothetical protein